MLTFLVAVTLSYLLGSIPIGFLVAKARGIDLRVHGSGNVGATNAGRVLGKRVGFGVFAGDFLKGLLPVLAAGFVATRSGLGWSRDAVALALGVGAICGHVFPVWLRFKGGKGVATSAGACAGMHWQTVLITLLIWLTVVKAFRFVSLASMIAAAASPLVFVAIIGPSRALHERPLVTGLLAALALAIIVLHRANIGRLLRGEEHRLGAVNSTGGKS